MVFLLVALDLALYIACGYSFYKGNNNYAIVLGIIAVVVTVGILIYYSRKQSPTNDVSLDSCGNLSCMDCGNGITQKKKLRVSTNFLRIMTGFISGVGLSILVVGLVRFLVSL